MLFGGRGELTTKWVDTDANTLVWYQLGYVLFTVGRLFFVASAMKAIKNG